MAAKTFVKLIICTALACLNGFIWYSPNIGFGRLWASNAWPSKTIEQIGQSQPESAILVTLLTNLVVIILFWILLR